MPLNFEIPIVPKDTHGVYAVIFDDQYTYIGSSKNLKSRFSYWVTLLKNKKPSNRNIKAILSFCKTVKFEIIEIVSPYLQRLHTEQYYIRYGEEKGLYKNILNINDAPNPDLKKMWESLPPIREDGLMYFPCKKRFYGKFAPKKSNYPILK